MDYRNQPELLWVTELSGGGFAILLPSLEVGLGPLFHDRRMYPSDVFDLAPFWPKWIHSLSGSSFGRRKDGKKCPHAPAPELSFVV